jgi:hypothetical protein
MKPKIYVLKKDSNLQPEAKAGSKVYEFLGHDFGCASEDTRNTGREHISVTLDSEGNDGSFTVPLDELTEVPAVREVLDATTDPLSLESRAFSRRDGHSALRVGAAGELERFDPHPETAGLPPYPPIYETQRATASDEAPKQMVMKEHYDALRACFGTASALRALLDIEMETRKGGQWTLAEVNEVARAALISAQASTGITFVKEEIQGEPLAAASSVKSEASRPDSSQAVPDGMWFFKFFCEDYDSVQRVRMNANAPRQFTCGVTGIVQASAEIEEASAGWRIENGKRGDELRYRNMERGWPTWTADKEQALRFARRTDAEKFAAEDEDAWLIVPVEGPRAMQNERLTKAAREQPSDEELAALRWDAIRYEEIVDILMNGGSISYHKKNLEWVILRPDGGRSSVCGSLITILDDGIRAAGNAPDGSE